MAGPTAGVRAAIGAATVILAACTGATGPTAAPAPTATWSPTPSATATPTESPIVLVRGTSRCNITAYAETTADGNDVVTEHFSCIYDMSDTRLNGAVEADFTTTIQPTGAAAGRWEGNVRIANPDGAWEGPAKGSLVFWPGANAPMNYGEGIYEGSGAYAGLRYHELVAGGDMAITVSGWIETAD